MSSQNTVTTIIEEGALLGDLRLVRQIGRGAQGVVYEAVQSSMGRNVAVKILPGETTFSEEQVERFKREAGAAGRLNHANVVSVFGFEEVGGHRVLIQELVTGGSLEGELREREAEGRTRGPDHLDWCIDVVRQIAWGLQHAHDENVIHRDIKPGNILLSEDGTPKLADFGLAKVEGELGLSMTGAVMGTPHYMSPEQVAAGRDGIDHRTDLYSLGALLYRMITGVVPLDGESRQGLFIDIMTRAPVSPRTRVPGLSQDLDAVCLKALEKAPDDRYQSARDFAEDLGRTMLGESTVARPLGPGRRAWRSVRRLATLSLVLFVLLVPLATWAVDLSLGGWVAADPARHDVRLALVAVGALLLTAPMAVLAVRLGRGRSGLRPVGVISALALGAVAAWGVHEQKLDALQGLARTDLVTHLEEQRRLAGFVMPSSTRIEALVDRWGPRFDDTDRLLVARALLVAERPLAAERWLLEALEDGEVEPLGHALEAAIAGGLGDDERAADAMERLQQALDNEGDGDAYLEAGDVFTDVGRYADAEVLYLAGGRLDGTDRNRVELALADVSARMCRWDDVRDHLTQYRKWNDEDAVSAVLAFQLANVRGTDADASEALRRLQRLVPPSMLLTALQHERASLVADRVTRETVEAAEDLYRRVLADHGDDVSVLAWCAKAYLDDSEGLAVLRADAYNGGDMEAFEAWDAALRDYHQKALGLLASIATRAPDRSTGPAGLAGVELERARYVAGEDRLLLQRSAYDHARRAVELDPDDWVGHYNLYLASKALLFHEHGVRSAADLPVDAIDSYLVHMRAAIDANGLQVQALNDTAYTLSYVYDDTADRAVLDEAIGYALRAVQQVEQRSRGVICPRDVAGRRNASSVFDTARLLMERAERRDEAIVFAQKALDALRPGDRRYASRQETLERLTAGD